MRVLHEPKQCILPCAADKGTRAQAWISSPVVMTSFGVQVIIAGAGGAAHLPGMVAALTPLPVIGVPVTPKGAHLDGLDALMSIVQVARSVQALCRSADESSGWRLPCSAIASHVCDAARLGGAPHGFGRPRIALRRAD